MSIITRRVLQLGGALGWANTEADTTLLNLSTLLQAALTQIENHGGHTYTRAILLSMALVNAALNDRSRNLYCQTLARQSATTVLSTISSLINLVPDLLGFNDRDAQYLQALSPHLKAINASLTVAHSIVVRILASPLFLSSAAFDSEVSKCCKEMDAAYRAFSLKMSFFNSAQDIESRKAPGAWDTDGHVLAWHQVDLREACHLEPLYDFISPSQDKRPVKIRRDMFWEDTFKAVVKGKPVTVKTYSADTIETFRRDVEILKSHRHSNLPALFGYSSEASSTPFIAMGIESFVPVMDFFPLLSASSPQTALGDAWKMLISMRRAAEHLVLKGYITQREGIVQSLEAAVVDGSGRAILSPSFSPRDLRDIPASISDIPRSLSFVYRRNGDTNMSPIFPSFDNLPRVFRPLRYALIINPSEALRPSHARLSDPQVQRAVLSQWRPTAAQQTYRSIAWPVPFDTAKPVAVGDFGRLLKGPNGQPVFVRLGNAQDMIGGFQTVRRGYLNHYEHVSTGVWKFWKSEDGTDPFFRWTMFIPSDMALDFLSRNARGIGKEHQIPPEDIVLIAQITLDLRTTKSQAKEQQNLFVHFNDRGCPTRAYWSELPINRNSDHPLLPEIDPTVTIRPLYPHCIKYLQVEEDELVDRDAIARVAPPSLCIGDIGYFPTSREEGSEFRVLSNAKNDLFDLSIQPWWGNNCIKLCGKCCPRIWCSPLILPGGPQTLLLNWSVNITSYLPSDLERFYLFWIASKGATEELANNNLQLVDRLVHQVYAQVPSDVDRPLRLFIHFDQEHRPYRAYWLDTVDTEPWTSAEDLPTWSSQGITIRPGISHALSGFFSYGDREEPTYRKLHNNQPPAHELKNSRGCRPGDVGFWARDKDGRITEEWVKIGHAALPGEENGTSNSWQHSSMSRNGVRCKQAGPRLYLSRRLDPSEPDSLKPADYRWVESLGPHEASFYSEVLETAVKHTTVPPEDILFVSSVTTNVHAAASEEVFRKNIPLRYKLRLYTLFPPEGGSYSYWSRYDHTRVNPKALSKLDLEGWQLENCIIRKSVSVERESLLKLSGPNPHGSLHSIHKFGARIGDYGWDAAAHYARQGKERPAYVPPMWVMGNMFDDQGNRDLEVTHGSETSTPCAELSPGIWASGPFNLGVGADSSPGNGESRWWWKASMNHFAIIEDVCYIAKSLVRGRSGMDIDTFDLKICTGIKTSVTVKPLAWQGPKAQPRFIGCIEQVTPLTAKFRWCFREPPCGNSSCHCVQPEQTGIEISHHPIIETMGYFESGAKLWKKWNPTVVLDEKTLDIVQATLMEDGYMSGGDGHILARDTPVLGGNSDEESCDSIKTGGFRCNINIW